MRDEQEVETEMQAKGLNAELGRKIARENARVKIWALEGYLLRELISGGIIVRRQK